MSQQVRAAVFRPADDRIDRAVELLESLGATPVPDPMLAVEPTDAMPEDGDYVILTSKTGVELLDEAGWEPGGSVLCCIGPATADAARGAGWIVDRVPEEYTSLGLVEHLAPDVDGATVEVARSDHGSQELIDGLREAGAEVHETVLYRLTRPNGSGKAAEMAATGNLEAALFTSSLTVEHLLDAAEERGIREKVIAGLNDAIVGAIGPPTRETAESHGIDVTVVPDEATFEALACDVVETAAPTYHE
ncbi:uroporphyrinogen-III synthase [Haloferax mediterranei ATCC 33500]|uniref:Uroporphyrinogen-III synthase n=1 Tax=Haloferax mediterranei (strain ATCC 33500 / DSM 1411 / JCM 8866 / NBRC 14739 / NCIMB 2177 / R-4) TaxID=523841 RepID=I3R0R8_HALMT|nr:uroporphyrinogen-III synthase [Haloferax mediterranei]AFK17828.1 uroporphyrinogen-III synthase [Haloferax mediterranei ATCC 33500]AHZ22746.1 uroporphyrinogen III synthase [Haloferax mediterranei ATCC 33500]EMA02900.1 uroporphyrinogen-III synthase [Haloferax mediterranei ATCC 33500]MDX5987916.1 uroporphyrinogen-III synthase [Haloferax mediterranei ATCC 33500]QCQ74389.1 uroporphyrinogen-III synthase [Haloferax mediterranei ATCC 33500]